jgi:hypothetical protein
MITDATAMEDLRARWVEETIDHAIALAHREVPDDRPKDWQTDHRITFGIWRQAIRAKLEEVA